MHSKPLIQRRRLIAALVGCLVCTSVQADFPRRGDDADREHGNDHDRARYALARGEARPIAEILQAVATEIPGEVIEVEFERKRMGHQGARIWIYELKIIASDGRLLEVLVDAATARILDVEED